MGELRIVLDSKVLEYQPEGLDALNQRINYSFEDKLLGIAYDGNLTFTADGFDILWNAYNNGSENVPCQVEKRADSGWIKEIDGVVTLSAVKFNRFRGEAETDIEDDGLYSRLRNNFQMPVWVTSAISKNGVNFTGLSEFNLACFNPATGVRDTGGGGAGFATNGLRKGYDLKEVLRVLISTCTDDTLALVSDWYDALGTYEQVCFLTGKALRTAVADPFETSMSDIWNFISNTHNLVLYPDGTNINVEQNTDLENTLTFNLHNDVPDVHQYMDQGRMYAGIKFGTKGWKETGSFPYERFITFRDEKYYFAGLSNTDSILDFSDNGFIVDSNRIEDVLVNDNSEYDSDIFVIAYNSADGWAAQDNPLNAAAGASARVYNEIFLNSSIADRYQFQNNIQVTEADSTNAFKAYSTDNLLETASGFVYPIPFQDDCTDGFDPSLVFDGGAICGGGATYLFTAQDTGVHTFQLQFEMCFEKVDGRFEYLEELAQREVAYLDMFVELVNGAGAVIGSEQVLRQTGAVDLTNAPTFPRYVTFNSYVSAADTVGVRMTASSNRLAEVDYTTGEYVPLIKKFAIFEATYLPGEGTLIKSYDSNLYINQLVEFEKPLSDKERRDMIADPKKAIKVFDREGNILGFSADVDSNILTGETSFKLRTSKSLIN